MWGRALIYVLAWSPSRRMWDKGFLSIMYCSTFMPVLSFGSDNGLLPVDVAAAIGRVKGAKRLGVRAGNWLLW